MKIRLTWEEYKEVALLKIKERFPNATSVSFRKNYSYEPEGDVYEFADFVDVEIED